MFLVSPCLLGMLCRAAGGRVYENKEVIDFTIKWNCIPACPEILAGLPTPRPLCEIVNGGGYDVLDGKAKVVTSDGRIYTTQFILAAQETLKLIKLLRLQGAILRSRSPSCGTLQIYSGKFDGSTTLGRGVTSAYLQRNGIYITDENNLPFEEKCLNRIYEDYRLATRTCRPENLAQQI